MIVNQINSWYDWVRALELIPDYPDYTSMNNNFRGQANKSWKLCSSLTRLAFGDTEAFGKLTGYENEALLEYKAQVSLVDPGPSLHQSDDISMRIHMQHHSAPTRLIDWTTSPFIALYFSVNDLYELDGAVYYWRYSMYLANLSKKYPRVLDLKGDDILNYQEADIVTPIYSLLKNERLTKQQGHFTVSQNIKESHCDIIKKYFNNPDDTGLFKFIIPKELKIEFLHRLKLMNITASTLFPGIDGLGKSIKEQLLIRRNLKK